MHCLFAFSPAGDLFYDSLNPCNPVISRLIRFPVMEAFKRIVQFLRDADDSSEPVMTALNLG